MARIVLSLDYLQEVEENQILLDYKTHTNTHRVRQVYTQNHALQGGECQMW